MKNNVSAIVFTLVTSGFKLAVSEKWGNPEATDNQVYQIYIHPEHCVIVTFSTIDYVEIETSQIFFSWKPKNSQDFEDIYNSSSSSMLPWLRDFYLDGVDTINIKDMFDITKVGFCDAESSYFPALWNFYTSMVEKKCLLPWQPSSPNIVLLKPGEEIAFSYQFVIDSDKYYTADKIREVIEYEIEGMRAAKVMRLSLKRFQQALSNLDLPPENFGLSSSQ
jgi:hypothetical protein